MPDLEATGVGIFPELPDIGKLSLLVENRLHRINCVASPGEFSLDDAGADSIAKLSNVGWQTARNRQHLEVVRQRFLNGTPANRFEPFQR
jgi:hypothetical protein